MRKPLAAVAVAALLSLCAACGGSDDIADDDPSTSPTTTTTTSPTAPPTSPTTSAPTTSAPTSSSPTDDDGDRLVGAGFSIAIPEEWEDITASLKEKNPQLDIAIGEKDATVFRTNFNVVTATATTATVEADAAELHKEAAAQLKTVTHATVAPLPDRDIAGDAAIGQTSKFEASGTSVTFVQYLCIHDGKAYPVTMTFATANAEKATATLDTILATWQWTS